MSTATSFARPSTRPDEIHNLLTGVERYNPQKIGVLEDYLAHQCANPDPNTNHDLMANLALLKMYQFNPPMMDLDVIRRILAKALISTSQGDFNLCLYLLSDDICKDISIAKLLVLRDYLEKAQFDGFWSEMYGNDDDDEESVVDGIAGFDNGLRKLILAEITSTYQTIQAKLIGKMVNLDEEAVLRLAKEHGWDVDAAGVVSLPLKSENEAKTTVIKESIKFEQLTKLLCAANDI
ncbi:ARM repeat-containing protein [Coemansia reversa NRRL 1564]|uniref:Eukaryotic translation initiation factor 3 subunit K n=1 Tax=Coemansia reversa (strain ATCC 12441 / NRRL 1564) TaxID=763665 RepID=A0A2G5BIB0_COERN|nr:ARM repeat-containing protein [Coemansia reversa NRRL 1564]|eukprot:PIA18497.1 ARM repeat-containing protein [Coemansia reversa NRRL 1564]